MGQFQNISIKRKQMLIIMLTSSVALLMATAAYVVYEVVAFRQAMKRDLSSQAAFIAEHVKVALSFERPDEAETSLNALRVRERIVAACVYKDDAIVARYPRSHQNRALWPAKPGPDGFHFESDRLELFQPLISDGNRVGTIYLQSDLKELDERLQRYAGIVGLVLAASLLVSLFLSIRLQRVISEPVLHLADVARTVSEQKNYSVRAVKQGQDELGALIDGFNEMLTQIQERDAALQKGRDDLEQRVVERTRELQQEIGERSRAEGEARQQLKRITLLNQITHAIAERQDLESILLVVLHQLEDHLPIDFGTVYRVDAQADTFNTLVRGPRSQPLAAQLGMPSIVPIAQTPFRPCLKGELVYVPDGTQLSLPIAQKMSAAGLCSAVAVPLLVESKVFGVLIVVRRMVNGFDPAECEFLRGLSAHVALAVHQARLHQDLQKAYDDLRQTQQAIMQQQRLQALGQMASGIAHDINNALSPVIAYTDLLQRSEHNLSDHAQKWLRNIHTAGEDIAQIVARMREFYRRRDERETLVQVQLNDVARQVVELTRPRWRDIPQSLGIVVEMQTELDPDLPEITGNGSELREALANLILNAVDAMPGGGKLTLRTCREQRAFGDGAQGKPRVILEVADTGIGMNEETRRRCLEPFFSTKGQRGTGMGLAMVYGIMERHEGKIEVESQPGRGTTMRLIFPVHKAVAGVAADLPEAAALPPLRILCVDDEPLLRDLLRELLASDGHKVETADGGDAGLAAFEAARQRGETFDVVITDLGMPYVDGRQVARTIKHASPATPVLMLTGWGTMMKSDGDLPAQVDDVLSKPPKINELREALRRATQQRKSS
ncbi:MAG: ATP-binding protein [Verrucomicrobiota bacterium]